MPAPLAAACHLVTGNLQQAAVHRVGNSFFLHRRIHYHALQIFGFDSLHGDGRVDGRLEQQFEPFLCEVAAKAPDLRGIAGQAVLVVVQAAEELPDDVLAPAHDKFFVAEVETVFEVQQAGHQAYG